MVDSSTVGGIFQDPIKFTKFFLGMELRPYQEEVLRACMDNNRVAIRMARQMGKSTVVAVFCLYWCFFRPRQHIVIVSKSHNQAKLLFDKIRELVLHSEYVASKLTKDFVTEMCFDNESWIKALPSGLTGDTIRGHDANVIILEESAFIPDGIVSSVVKPMAGAKKDNKIIQISTPVGHNHFYDCFKEGSTYSTFHYSYQHGEKCGHYAEGFIEEMRGSMPQIEFEREYCYHRDTEYLTEEGWKKYSDIKNSEKLGCFNPQTEELIYLNFTNRTEKYSKKMMEFNANNKPVFSVTPSHQVYCGLDRIGGCFGFKAAKDCWKIIHVKDRVKWSGNEIDKIEIPILKNNCLKCGYVWNYWKTKSNGKRGCRSCGSAKVKTTNEFRQYNADNFIQFLGYFISEGFVSSSDVPIKRKISISQKVGEKANIMKKVLDKFKKPYKTKEDMLVWRIYDKWLVKWLRDTAGRNSITKRIPKFLFSTSQRQLKLLFDSLILGDGWKNTGGSAIYYGTISPGLASDMMELGLKLGYSVYCYSQKNGMHKISFYKSNKYRWLKKSINPTYNDVAYCFTVPTGLLVTKFNGRISIQGNCANFIEDENSAFPWRIISQGIDSSLSLPPSYTSLPIPGVYRIGYDVGRYTSNAVFTVIHVENGIERLVYYKEMSGVKWELQFNYLAELCAYLHPERVTMDATPGSMGGPVAEQFKSDRRTQSFRLNPVGFTTKSKHEMVNNFIRKIESELLKYPNDKRFLDQCINQRSRMSGGGGSLKVYSPPKNSQDDVLWATILAVWESQSRGIVTYGRCLK